MGIEEEATEMNVLLVQPIDKAMNYRAKRPVLGLAYIGTILKREGHKVFVIDLRFKSYKKSRFLDILKSFKPDMAAFSVTALTVEHTFELIKLVKEKTSAKVVAGGPEVTSLPNNFLKNKLIDFIIVGEGDFSFSEFVNKAENGRDFSKVSGLGFRRNGKFIINPCKVIDDLDSIPFPNWDIFPLKGYNKKASKIKFPILTSRGCPYRCSYCPSSRINFRYRVRSAKNVVDEMEHLIKKYGARNFQVMDDNFAVVKQRVFDICDDIIKRNLKVKWVIGQGFTANHADFDMFKKMKEAGCILISIGVESSDPEILRNIEKPATREQMLNALKLAKKAGITTKANFICGLPGATYKTEMGYIDFFKEADVDIPRFGNIMVFPNTPLYDWAKKNAKMLVDIDSAHNTLSSTKGTLSDDKKMFMPVFETKEFTKEERVRAMRKCSSEADKWALQNIFGKHLGYITWIFSRSVFLRKIGENVLDMFDKY